MCAPSATKWGPSLQLSSFAISRPSRPKLSDAVVVESACTGRRSATWIVVTRHFPITRASSATRPCEARLEVPDAEAQPVTALPSTASHSAITLLDLLTPLARRPLDQLVDAAERYAMRRPTAKRLRLRERHALEIGLLAQIRLGRWAAGSVARVGAYRVFGTRAARSWWPWRRRYSIRYSSCPPGMGRATYCSRMRRSSAFIFLAR